MIRLLLIAAVATGCSATNPYRSPTALGKGTTELLVAPQVHAAGPQDTGKAPFPELAIGARHGVTPTVDAIGTVTALPLGDKLSSYSIEAGARIQLYDGERYDIGIGGSVGYRLSRSSGAVFETVHATLPLSVGVRLGRHQLILSPALGWQRWYSMGTNPVNIPSVGASLGFRWKVGERYTLQPELGWSVTPVELNNFERTVLLHLGFAITRRH